jgi:predicted HTH transcriptional regulator
LNLHTREGKAKFLKHICAPYLTLILHNSYIVVGVEDQDNEIIGDFFDDSRIQNLVNAYLENPPKTIRKRSFPQLPKDKVVGLVTIRPKNKPSYLKKEFIPLLQTALLSGAEAIPRLLSNQSKTTTQHGDRY